MVNLRHFRVVLEHRKLLSRCYISYNYTVSQCVQSLQRYKVYSLTGNEKSFLINSLTQCKLIRRNSVKTAHSKKSKEYRLNSNIKAKNVRLIDQEGKNLGIITLKEALEKGKKENCLVVEVRETPSETVCKLVSQQQLYEKMKEEKKNVKTRKIKEVKVTAKICKHDLDIKLKKIVEFLEDRDSVKVFVAHRRLQNTNVDDKKALIQRIAELVSDVGCLQGEVKVVGNGVRATFIPLQRK
ncbi:uncharacterized protein LOC114521298 [Dendronephthya gigantea]|uniref:uncharacterized protein LOC114521298 n=1 Tax=Dendronephthya gigantea TaxID=151771 RepID=UPI00106D3377|nr:uncharacterized protein LOC114521298 [Dendronephthya gigantea]